MTAAQERRDRALAVDGLLNVRDLGGLPTRDGRWVRTGCVVRSDNLSSLTEGGAATLIHTVGPRLVVDLRTEVECGREGRGLANNRGIGYVNVPLQPLAALTEEQVAAGLATTLLDDYVMRLEHNGDQLVSGLRLLTDAAHLPVLVHCTAGKDRTGVFIALLLELLGVEREEVVADYGDTAANMAGVLARIRSSPFFQANGLAAAPDWIFASDPATMRQFLRHVDVELGGVQSWALGRGLTDEDLRLLRDNLLEPQGRAVRRCPGPGDRGRPCAGTGR